MTVREEIKVRSEEEGERLDKLLASRFPEQSRTYFQSLIDQEMVLLNLEKAKKRTKVAIGDKIEITFLITPEFKLEAEEVPLEIVWEDDHLLAINKPAGLVVHPGPKNWTGTVANGLLFLYGNLEEGGEGVRPGIVHRLDKETSGLLLCAKNAQVQAKMMALFAERKVKKRYLAITVGKPKEGLIDAPIGRHPKDRRIQIVREDGKQAKTFVSPLGWDEQHALVECDLQTGRTHQIRVHLKHHTTPILGDPTYGVVKPGYSRQMLHAGALDFVHPVTGEDISLRLAPPDDMLPTCKRLYPEVMERCGFSSSE